MFQKMFLYTQNDVYNLEPTPLSTNVQLWQPPFLMTDNVFYAWFLIFKIRNSFVQNLNL